METYYARRAAEYEKIYDKPERQADLARLRAELPPLFKGERVVEIACGTGYWTPLIAAQAESVLGVDAVEDVLAIARNKDYPGSNVRFEQADAYALPAWPEKFSACCAGFWWSHVPLARLDSFLKGLESRLEPGARVVFFDNLYVEGSSTPISRRDAEGNAYQQRRLADGSSHEVLKNFPTAKEMQARLAPYGTEIRFLPYEYYWVATYRIMAGTTLGRTP
jgi:demethylmenaquinone methyltransferase/2-methoxy-6-polyprenyl-1,4-benzoquinol methylase